MLGRGLQEYLRAHAAVKSLRYGNEEEGSTGVTLIELRDVSLTNVRDLLEGFDHVETAPDFEERLRPGGRCT